MTERPVKVRFRAARVKDDPVPAADIIKGSPKARTFLLYDEDGGRYACGIWHCSPGTFDWTFGVDEFVYFLEGDARIRYEGGRTIRVKGGEAAHFPPGRVRWTITRTVKKVFVARS
ncbi:MAG TPA: cupin domain-containing protein [Thermoplasmata archaeon]|nr:cupin domain-containing protein [Thermoplasmata archaeon]